MAAAVSVPAEGSSGPQRVPRATPPARLYRRQVNLFHSKSAYRWLPLSWELRPAWVRPSSRASVKLRQISSSGTCGLAMEGRARFPFLLLTLNLSSFLHLFVPVSPYFLKWHFTRHPLREREREKLIET
ncbi:hypothetical protein CapIbe_012018 [Capra ibex]